MKDILIRFDTAEALVALGAIQDKALDAARLAAISTGDEHEIADLSWKILQRLATRLTDAIYPACDWMDNSPCDMPVTGSYNDRPYCAFHLARLVPELRVPA